MKSKISITIVLALFCIVAIVFGYYQQKGTINEIPFYEEQNTTDSTAQKIQNLTFSIQGTSITLEDGVSRQPILPNSASLRTVRYFGNEVESDIDGDGDLDSIFLITDDSGGSGTFYYIVGALLQGGEYTGTKAKFVGDRIAPQTTSITQEKIVLVTYADRSPDEPMSATPSIGKSIYLRYNPDTNSFDDISNEYRIDTKRSLIQVFEPTEGVDISNPVTVLGKARGYWFFEGSFSVVIVDWDGRIVGEGYATAQGDWMTEDFVPFFGTIEYTLPKDIPYTRGTIIFKKDNPSGLPEHDDAFELPVNLQSSR